MWTDCNPCTLLVRHKIKENIKKKKKKKKNRKSFILQINERNHTNQPRESLKVILPEPVA